MAQTVDLVLEGGGVKGIGVVGAISVLEEHGMTFARVAVGVNATDFSIEKQTQQKLFESGRAAAEKLLAAQNP